MNPIIQIAGIKDIAEAELIITAGANYLGFPLRLPDGREDLSEEDAKQIIYAVGSNAETILITYLNKAEEIIDLCCYLGVTGVQLHGSITTSELTKIKISLPDLFIIKSLVVHPDKTTELKAIIDNLSENVSAFITDTFDPQTGKSGATGKTHDWSVSRKLVKLSPKPVILAGGLGPDNVSKAIGEVQPAGVDAHSRVEDPMGRKDAELVSRFVAEAKQAFQT